MNKRRNRNHWWRRWLNNILAGILPSHGHRIVFLTTLFGHVSNLSDSHHRMLKELNERLELVRRDRALGLPLHMHQTVWGGRSFDCAPAPGEAPVLTEEELDILAERAMRCNPKWSNYSERAVVRQETKEVLRISFAALNDEQLAPHVYS